MPQRCRVPSGVPDVVKPEGSDGAQARWIAIADHLAADIRAVLSGLVRAVDHIGSSSVPGRERFCLRGPFPAPDAYRRIPSASAALVGERNRFTAHPRKSTPSPPAALYGPLRGRPRSRAKAYA